MHHSAGRDSPDMRHFAYIAAVLLAGTAYSQTGKGTWPDNAKWPAQIDGFSLEFKRGLNEVALPGDRLAGRFRADEIRLIINLEEGDAFAPNAANIRFIRFWARSGEVTVPPLPPGALVALGSDTYAATPPTTWLGFRPEERFAVLAKIQRANRSVWYAFAVSLRDAAPRRPVLSKPELTPSFAPAQKLLDGTKRLVGRSSFRESVRNVFANQRGTWFDLVLDGTLSTARLDPEAYGRLEFQVGRAFGPLSSNTLGFQVGSLASQSGRTASGYANLGAAWVLPGKFARPSHILTLGAAPQIELGVRGEQRWKRDFQIFPYHIKTDLIYSYLRGHVGPLWLFPRNSQAWSFERDSALFVDLGAFWLPDDESRPGFEKRPLETYFGLTMTLPLRVLFFSPELFFHSGALEGQSFTRVSTFGLGLTSGF